MPDLTRPKFLALQPSATWTSNACLDASSLAMHDELDRLAGDVFAQTGLGRPAVTTGGHICQWTLRVSVEQPSLPEPARLVWDAGSGEPDRFAVVTALTSPNDVSTTIFATSERGAAFGLRGTVQFFVDRNTSDSQRVQEGVMVDYAGFSRRGIIEGFYGPTFSVDDRSNLIALAGYLRQNVYIYALKDADPFTHARWRNPYDATWAPIIANAASAAKRNLVDFVWAVSPGWYGGPTFQQDSIHYGSDLDFKLLVDKTENLRSLGVERFALFVDDVAPDFMWPDDAGKFPSLAAAQAYLMNRWDDYLIATGAPDHLWVVGTKYTSDTTNGLSGDGWQDYNRTLASALHPEIQIFWTGPQVYSEHIATDDLMPIEAIVQRQVLIWDNWPKAPLALTGRAFDLDRSAGGLLSNFVMDNATSDPTAALHDFEHSLGTIADYAWQPDSYDPDASLERWTPSLDQLLRRLPASPVPTSSP